MTTTTCPECHSDIRLTGELTAGAEHRYYCSSCERIVHLRPEARDEGRRILVVEDTQTIREVVADMLRQAGFEVETAADGEESLRKIDAFHPDLVLLDLVLPGKDGFDVLRALSSREDRPAVLVVSGALSRTEAIKKVHELGAVGFIPKTALRETLLFRVGNILDMPAAS